MSLIPHSFFPRRFIDVDSWMKPSCELCNSSMMNRDFFGPTSLDMFDPFDELDSLMGKKIDWIQKPDFVSLQPLVQQKYRITVDCPGFELSRNNIKIEANERNLTVTGHDKENLRNGDYSTKEFRRTYELPEGAQTDKIASFMPMAGVLIIEVPLKDKNQLISNDLFPKIHDSDEGRKVSVSFGVPEIDPSKIKVNVKDRDLIIQADDTKTTHDGTSKFHFYKRTTLPADTDFDNLKVTWNKSKLTCNAPLRGVNRAIRSIPVQREQIEVKHF